MLAIYVLLILMIIGAIVAIEVKDTLSTVVTVGAVGLGVSLLCLILKAPDVAITQFVVEIIALVILVRATVRMDLSRMSIGHRVIDGIVALIFIGVLLVVALAAFQELAPFGAPEMRVSQTYLIEGLRDTGATNMVSAILLDFRAYDTLGEATVLFTAVMGTLAVVRRVGRKEEGSAAGRDDE